MKVLAPSLLILLFCFSAAAQAPDLAAGNSLEELRDKRNVLLVVFKSRVIDASDREGAIIDDVCMPIRIRRAGIAGSTPNSLKSSISTFANTRASVPPVSCPRPIT